MQRLNTARFSLGQLLATPSVLKNIPNDQMLAALNRHACGDWGDVNEHDRQANNAALREGTRLLSAYHTDDGTCFWIITEADRSATTVLLPEEY